MSGNSDDDHCDVITTPQGIGKIDQSPGGGFGTLRVPQYFTDSAIIDMGSQSIGTEDKCIPDL